jgi:hypothetical protein
VLPDTILGSVQFGVPSLAQGEGAAPTPATIVGTVSIGLPSLAAMARVQAQTILGSVSMGAVHLQAGLPLPEQDFAGTTSANGLSGQVQIDDPIDGVLLPTSFGGSVSSSLNLGGSVR